MVHAASNCKHVYDAFVEHLNAQYASVLPSNTPITFDVVKAASSIVKPRWELLNELRMVFGMKRKQRKAEILEDRDRVRSASFRPTFDATVNFIVEKFDATIQADNLGQQATVAFVNKSKIGFEWLPFFLRAYDKRKERATWPKGAETREREASARSEKLEELKRDLTYDEVQAMKNVDLRALLTTIKLKGRGKLQRKADMVEAIAREFNLTP